MAHDDDSIKAVTTHTPVIRNNLLMLMGGRTLAELTSTEGKEKLRAESLAEVQRILKGFDDKNDVEDLYFTSFVVQ
jgi:flagellar FliL protein